MEHDACNIAVTHGGGLFCQYNGMIIVREEKNRILYLMTMRKFEA